MKQIFTTEQVQKIRRLAWLKVPYYIIAEEMQANFQTVYQAARGFTYQEVTDPPALPARKKVTARRYDDDKPRCKRCEILSETPLCEWCQEKLAKKEC